tara:strand:+ start:33357 stop:34223 length:867 start_codon:yes stop_codon:yes gene_type:complete
MLKYICYNWFGTIADHALDFSRQEYAEKVGVGKLHDKTLVPDKVDSGDVIFVKTDYIYHGMFQNNYLPQINKPFILVTGGSSYQISQGASIDSIINSPYLIKWYCTNAPSVPEKIVPLPIGFEEPDREGGNQEVISEIRDSRTSFANKKNKILLPYHTLNTNPARTELFQKLRSLPFVETQEEKLSFEDYLRKVDQYKFVICLEGSGPDVHRNYEALLVDTVPINKDNVIKRLFEYYGLPGEFVDSWSILSEEYLGQLLGRNYNTEKVSSFLDIEKHTQSIKNTKDNL